MNVYLKTNTANVYLKTREKTSIWENFGRVNSNFF